MRRSFITALVMATTVALLGSTAVTAGAAPPKPTKITLNATAKTLTVGQTFTAKVKKASPAKANKKVKWTSAKKSVATVTGKGLIKAVGAGTATITAKSVVRPKVKGKIKVTVKKAPVVIDPKLLGGWGLFITGAGSIDRFKADGTWTSIVIFEGSFTSLQSFSKGNYQARNGQIRYSNILNQQRKTDDDPWSAFKPLPNRIENYEVGTDEYGEYLVTEPHPDPITPESVKYRRQGE